MEAMIKIEMKAAKLRLRGKRKHGTKAHIGHMPGMTGRNLRAEAEANIRARLLKGVPFVASASDSASTLSSSSLSLSSDSSLAAPASSASSASSASPASSPSVLGDKFLSGLIFPGATHRGNKVIKFASMLFKAAPELWSKYSDAAEVSVEFQIAGKSQRTAVYNFMCKSIETLAPDFIDRVGIPTSEPELMTSAKSWAGDFFGINFS